MDCEKTTREKDDKEDKDDDDYNYGKVVEDAFRNNDGGNNDDGEIVKDACRLCDNDNNTNSDGEIVIDKSRKRQYKKGNFLGKGGYAKVYEFQDLKTNEIYAGKIMKKSFLNNDSHAKRHVANEIRVHRKLKHANIVKYHSCFEDKKCVYITTEICPEQSLKEILKKRLLKEKGGRLTETEAKHVMLQLVEGVTYLHQCNIVHRDLKIGNIMVCNASLDIKIGDFGLCEKLKYEGQIMTKVCGTHNYFAPEVLENSSYDARVDIWCLGVVMYTLLIGKPPFQNDSIRQIYENIRNNDYTYPPEIDISNNAKNLIDSILQLEPKKRLSLPEIRAHPFLSGTNTNIDTNNTIDE